MTSAPTHRLPALSTPPRDTRRPLLRPAAGSAVALAVLGLLSACGGGGGDSGSTPASGSGATVASVTVTAGSAHYGQSLVVTVTGTQLDRLASIDSSTCTGAARSTTAPYVSTATTAYFTCTPTATGALQVTAGGVASAVVTVPQPVVTLTVSNGAGVDGSIVITLAPDKAPITVTNFLAYVNADFYDGTLFHRVSPGFVLQGGGYAAPLTATSTPVAKATSSPIKLEAGNGLSNTAGTIAMARTGDADSATSQFFINLADNSGSLDPSTANGAGYAVFGTVSSGSATISAITAAPCTAIPFFLPTGDCTPIPNVVVVSAVQTQ